MKKVAMFVFGILIAGVVFGQDAYFESTEWQYKKIDNIDTYTNNNTIAIIISPYKRIDGNIVAEVVFRKFS
jgi:hypothetical protein